MSYTSQPTNAQSLNGVITLTDGVITIEDGTISGLNEIDLVDLQVSDTATIENLIVNNQIDMTNGIITNLANGTNANDAVNKSQLDLKADTTYVDTNFLNKTTTATQVVAGKLTFNNTTTDILNNPVIKFENNINSSSNGMVLQFKKNLINQPNLQIGGLVWLDQAPSSAVRRVCEMIVSNDSTSLPKFDIKFSSGVFNPLTIANTQTFLRNNDFYLINKTTTQTLLRYLNTTDEWEMFKPLDMNSNLISNALDPVSLQDVSTKNYVDTASVNTNYLKRDGTLAMSATLNMNSNLISNALDPVSAQDGATKNYTDTASVNTNYLKRDGTLAMSATLNMNSNLISNVLDPVSLQDASTKNYTDTASVNTNYLKRDGTLAMSATLNMNSNFISNLLNPTLSQDASTKNYVDTHSNNNNYLLKTGGTMTGAILMNTTTEIRLANNPADGNGARIYSDGGNTYYYTRGVGIYIALNNSANPTTTDGKIFISRDTTEVKNNFSVEGARKYNMKVYTANHTMIMNSETTGDMESIAIVKGSGITFKLPNQNFTYWRNRWYIIKSGSNNNTTIDFNGNTFEGATGTMNMDAYRQISLFFDENYGVGTNKLVWNITSQSNAP